VETSQKERSPANPLFSLFHGFSLGETIPYSFPKTGKLYVSKLMKPSWIRKKISLITEKVHGKILAGMVTD